MRFEPFERSSTLWPVESSSKRGSRTTFGMWSNSTRRATWTWWFAWRSCSEDWTRHWASRAAIWRESTGWETWNRWQWELDSIGWNNSCRWWTRSWTTSYMPLTRSHSRNHNYQHCLRSRSLVTRPRKRLRPPSSRFPPLPCPSIISHPSNTSKTSEESGEGKEDGISTNSHTATHT